MENTQSQDRALKKEISRKLHQKNATSRMLMQALEEINKRHHERSTSENPNRIGPVVIYTAGQAEANSHRRQVVRMLKNQKHSEAEIRLLLSASDVSFRSVAGTEDSVIRPLRGTINPAIFFDPGIWDGPTPDNSATNVFFIKQVAHQCQRTLEPTEPTLKMEEKNESATNS